MRGTFPVELAPEEQEHLASATARLQRLLDAADKFVADVIETPVPGSPIAKAYEVDRRDAFDIANHLLFATQDHLRAILCLVQKSDMLPAFSLFTLLRDAADALVRTRHLLDLRLSPAQRLGRALTDRLVNLREQDKVISEARNAGRLTPEDEAKIVATGSSLSARTAALETRAAEAGVSVLHDRRGDVSGFGESIPSQWQLFDRYLPEGALVFRMLSGHTHSMRWVQLPIGRAEASPDPTVALIPIGLDVKLLVVIVGLTLGLFDETVRYGVILAGQPISVWEDAKKGPTQ